MKTQSTVKLSRAETNRRISQLHVDAWKNLSGYIDGTHVNCWATGANRRIECVSICGIEKLGGNLAKTFRVAKMIKAATGLVVHFRFGMIGGVL